MKKILILLVVLAAIIGIAYYKSNERNSRLNRSTANVKSRELLFPEFDINGIRKVHVKEADAESTITVQNDTWVVAERGGYPAEKEKLQTALMSLKYEKIKAGRRIGKDSWGKIGVNAPGSDATGVGTLVELFDDKDVLKYSFVLGGQVTSAGGSNNDQMAMFGGPKGNRFIRLMNEDTIWEISDQLPDLVSKPDAWLAKGFFDVQKLKSVEVTAAKPEDSWKASRAEEGATDFVLEGAKAGEKIDAGKVTLGTLLSSPTFNDVLGKDKAADVMKGAVKAKLVTFDGFTYNVQAVKQAGQGGGDKYYLTVNVSADIPKERPAVKDEKPEDKTKNDAAFAEEKKKMEEKLANEKKFEGWVYEVTEYTVSSLLKKRHEILAAPDMKATPPEGGIGKPGGLPDIKNMIPGLNRLPPAPPAPAPPPASAVTPPVAAPPSMPPPASPLPETPKTEIKPAPSPDANPITGEKPAAPAKPAASPPPPAAAPSAEPAKPAADAPPAPAPDAKK